jgi:hypothetical protein
MTTGLLIGVVVVVAVLGVLFIQDLRAEGRRALAEKMLALFAPGLAAAQADPRALMTWYPLAETARRMFPEVFSELDRAARSRFPFTVEQVKAAHAQCTTEWLTWERRHDAEYKLKSAELELQAGRDGAPAGSTLRARIEEVEREKLELYQQRYAEYVRHAKALAALDPGT